MADEGEDLNDMTMSTVLLSPVNNRFWEVLGIMNSVDIWEQ